ncbi:hypothetical protein EVAR_19180_1 [Eumeta japonica]|uniref:Uncharacterized protein n=1 Tax=Eumeta variegata TaxID=151549 RepID=A0A4C1VN01_EUMVA|nr:hypothetical protein EVAR_19180_1 [Eumeta japonica]
MYPEHLTIRRAGGRWSRRLSAGRRRAPAPAARFLEGRRTQTKIVAGVSQKRDSAGRTASRCARSPCSCSRRAAHQPSSLTYKYFGNSDSQCDIAEENVTPLSNRGQSSTPFLERQAPYVCRSKNGSQLQERFNVS